MIIMLILLVSTASWAQTGGTHTYWRFQEYPIYVDSIESFEWKGIGSVLTLEHDNPKETAPMYFKCEADVSLNNTPPKSPETAIMQVQPVEAYENDNPKELLSTIYASFRNLYPLATTACRVNQFTDVTLVNEDNKRRYRVPEDQTAARVLAPHGMDGELKVKQFGKVGVVKNIEFDFTPIFPIKARWRATYKENLYRCSYSCAIVPEGM